MSRSTHTILVTAAISALIAPLTAQTTTVFPSDYATVAEGPNNSPNLPLAFGTSRVLCVYDRLDLDIPVGARIQKLGFRQDATLTTMDAGRALQLEIRMGYTTAASTAPGNNFDNVYAAPPVTVFGPALFTLPNLRDAANPLADGRLLIPLTTAFPYEPDNRNLVVEYRVFGNSGGGTSFNYRLDRADFHSPVVNGPAGCAHSGGGTPRLTVEPCRVQGQFSAALATGPANSLAVLMVATGAQLLPPFSLQALVPGIAPACMGQIPVAGAMTLSAITGTTGSASFTFNIPNNAALYNDVWLANQVACFDFFAPGGVVVSNGAQVQIGVRPRSSILASQGPPATVITGTVNTNYAPVAFFEYQ